MEKAQSTHRPEATLSFAAKFVLKLFGLTILFSIIPLLFVNLPLGMFLMNFGKISILLIILANFFAIFLSGALAAKLIFAWGVSGFEFNITKASAE
ncbi:hypothetical protein LJR071_001985 [Pseudomonas sp. LjRoot71]|uniref:hypothetical protein n=1 Tax=Pseudomonas sp. LjRoot71 TaxID=3342336 RepID=UPI003ECF4CD1